MNSVTNIRPAFESGGPIEGPAEALDRLLDAMEHVPAKLDRQSQLAPRARFIDTEFSVGGGGAWQIAILDADKKPILVALIKRDHNRAFRIPRTNLRGINVLSPEQFAMALKELDGLRSTDVLIEWSWSGCDREYLKAVLIEGGFSGFEIEAIVPQGQNCLRLPLLAQRYLSRILHFSSWAEQAVFRCLFPQHHLATFHHEARIDATKACMIASVLIQLRKPPQRRSYSEGFLQNIHRYLTKLAPVVETKLNNHTLQTKLGERKRMVHEFFRGGSDKRQSKITEFLSVIEKIAEQADKVVSSVSSPDQSPDEERGAKTR